MASVPRFLDDLRRPARFSGLVPATARPYLYLCMLGLGLTLGCEEAREADLLDITSAGPPELDPGHPLVIEGGPFAIHHGVHVRLIGELARPFGAPEAISEDLPAQAVAEDRIEVPLPERTLREHFGRSTFRGRIEVREDAQWDGEPGAVLGHEAGVVIDFVPPRAIDASDRSLERVLGVTWASEATRGLEIASVEPDGRGAALGLSVGDALLGDGDAHFVPGDAPSVPEGATSIALIVSRAGEAERTALCTLGDRHDDDAARDLARLVQLSIVLVWIALLAAMPMTSIQVAAPRAPAALQRPSAALIARMACSVALAYVVVRLAAAGALPSAAIVIAGLAGLRATLTFVDARGEARAVPMAALSSLGLAAALALLPVAVGTADLGALARDQAPSLLAWPIFAEPVGPLALSLALVSIGTTRMRTFRVAGAIDDLLMLAIASLLVVEGTGLAPTGRLSAVATSVSIALGAWLLGHVRGRVAAIPGGVAIVALVGAAALVLGAWTFADPSTLVRTTAAETVLAMSVVVAIAIARRAVTPRTGSRTANALL